MGLVTNFGFFFDNSSNQGEVSEAQLANNSINLGSITSATLSDQSSNEGNITNADLRDSSSNKNNISTANFFDSSTNEENAVVETASFFNTTQNKGYITNGNFWADSTNTGNVENGEFEDVNNDLGTTTIQGSTPVLQVPEVTEDTTIKGYFISVLIKNEITSESVIVLPSSEPGDGGATVLPLFTDDGSNPPTIPQAEANERFFEPYGKTGVITYFYGGDSLNSIKYLGHSKFKNSNAQVPVEQSSTFDANIIYNTKGVRNSFLEALSNLPIGPYRMGWSPNNNFQSSFLPWILIDEKDQEADYPDGTKFSQLKVEKMWDDILFDLCDTKSSGYLSARDFFGSLKKTYLDTTDYSASKVNSSDNWLPYPSHFSEVTWLKGDFSEDTYGNNIFTPDPELFDFLDNINVSLSALNVQQFYDTSTYPTFKVVPQYLNFIGSPVFGGYDPYNSLDVIKYKTRLLYKLNDEYFGLLPEKHYTISRVGSEHVFNKNFSHEGSYTGAPWAMPADDNGNCTLGTLLNATYSRQNSISVYVNVLEVTADTKVLDQIQEQF